MKCDKGYCPGCALGDCPKMNVLRDFVPIPEAINSLPDGIRKYIHDLETLSDPTGIIQEHAVMKNRIEALIKLIDNAHAELRSLKAEDGVAGD
jgi:hypothetical protein